MNRHMMIAALLMGAGAPVAAQPAPVFLAQVFLSPAGEPFRAPRGAAYPVVTWFTVADRNQDGKLTASEFSSDFARFFNMIDRDDDGNLSDPEIRHYETVVAPEVRSGIYAGPAPKQRTGNDGVSGGNLSTEENKALNDRYEVPLGGASYGLLAIPQPVTGMDANINGVVTRSEALLAAQRRFRLLDRNHRGFLTLAELPRTQVQGLGGNLKRR